MRRNIRHLLWAACVLFGAVATGTEEGIFADFSTNMGDFTASLNATASPRAVANFIGLAEGSRAWIDPAGGAVWTGKPFYNGLTFHRVIAGFMIQGGSPNGMGTDGPGYTFRDETANGLLHDAPFVLSMANSGPNTNGSQFFITVASTPHLDGVHTVFGKVVSGQTVVSAINAVPTDVADKPVQPVVIRSVVIRREGVAARAFDIHAQELAVCEGSRGSLRVDPGKSATWVMPTAPPPGSVFAAFRSADLAAWGKLGEAYRAPDGAGYASVEADNAALPRAFYQFPLAIYPDAMGPSSMADRTLSAALSAGASLIFRFAADGAGGSGSYIAGSVTPFTFTLYQADPRPHAATWILQTSAFGYLRVRAALNSRGESLIYGTHKLDQYGQTGWAQVSSGALTLTR